MDATDQARKHYAEHVGKDFYPNLEKFMTSGTLMVAELEGTNIVERLRVLTGGTNPDEAEVGTLRSRFGMSITKNAVHASDSVTSAERELKLFFGED